jgi:glycosyltransferase involved in cell wall biosynthesis
MTPRVCMLIYHYWPGPEGGTERQCRRLAGALSLRGFACTVVTARPGRDVPARALDGGVRIVRLPILESFRRARTFFSAGKEGSAGKAGSSGRRAPPAATRLAATVRSWLNALLFQVSATVYLLRHAGEFDVIHVHTSEWIAGLAVWTGQRLRIPVLCKAATLPALPARTGAVPFSRTWDRLRREADFVALNDVMAAELRDSGIPGEKIRVIPNSVEIPDLSRRREVPACVLFVGNLSQHEHKAFDILFEAWARVSSAHPEARLTVLGGGDARPWERFLTEHGCRDSVSFAGFVRDVDGAYAGAAVLVLPSRQEGMSNALLEAQSWGVPAVVSDIPANRAIVTDGENGLVVPVNDAEALAAGVVRLLKDGEFRHRLGGEARRRTMQNFALDKIADETSLVYENLLRRADSRRRRELHEP